MRIFPNESATLHNLLYVAHVTFPALIDLMIYSKLSMGVLNQRHGWNYENDSKTKLILIKSIFNYIVLYLWLLYFIYI